MSDVFTAEQARAGRAMLKITQAELAERAGVPFRAVSRIESRQGPLSSLPFGTVDPLRAALEAGGIAFTSDNGVRLEARS